MAYATPPAKTEISATPSPSNATAKAGFAKLHDWLSGLFGTGGKPEHVYAAMKLLDSRTVLNLAPTFAVGSSALTITVKDKAGSDLSADNPGFCSMRSATVGSGDFNLRKTESNIALTVSSGSTLGQTSAVLQALYIYLIDNSGTLELAVSSTFRGESGIVSTTAEGGAGAADDADTVYSASARSSVPFRLIAIAWSTQTAAGTWASLPSEVKQQPFHLERVGDIVAHGGGAVEYGYLAADGSNVSRTTYAKLFAKYGTTHGVGDGSTTFGIPDTRRRTLVGSGGSGTGTLGNAVGNTGGEEAHTPAVSETAAHSHPGSYAPAVNASPAAGGRSLSNSAAETQQNTIVVASQGGGSAFNVMQPSMVVTHKIRWLGDI